MKVSVDHSNPKHERYWRRLRQGVAFGLCGAIGVLVVVTPLGEQLVGLLREPNSEVFQQWLATHGRWVPLLLIACMVAHTLVPLPAELLAIAAGIMLGPVCGLATIWVGAMLGAYLGFFLTRSCSPGLFYHLAKSQYLQRMQVWGHLSDIPFLLGVRLIPVISFNLVNFALGLTSISWWRFTWTTAVGIIPVTALTVIFGAYLHNWLVLAGLSVTAAVVMTGGFLWLRRRSSSSFSRVSS